MTTYNPNAQPGTYDHISRWCATCSPTESEVVLFFKDYKSPGPFRCTCCLRAEGEPRLPRMAILLAELTAAKADADRAWRRANTLERRIDAIRGVADGRGMP